MVLASWTTPDLSSVQADHRTAIPEIEKFNSAPGEFFLFSDSRFEQVLGTSNYYNGDYHDLQADFDGYALFTTIQYVYLKDQEFESISRGIFFTIPNIGLTGWVCTTE